MRRGLCSPLLTNDQHRFVFPRPAAPEQHDEQLSAAQQGVIRGFLLVLLWKRCDESESETVTSCRQMNNELKVFKAPEAAASADDSLPETRFMLSYYHFIHCYEENMDHSCSKELNIAKPLTGNFITSKSSAEVLRTTSVEKPKALQPKC